MDRSTAAALGLAGLSVVAILILQQNVMPAVRLAFALVLPLALIAFPEALATGFSMAEGSKDSTPPAFIRFTAWLLLVTMISVVFVVRLTPRSRPTSPAIRASSLLPDSKYTNDAAPPRGGDATAPPSAPH
ncbi:MAG TPA: hypothetical protein VGE52_20895 [Pirellulales bacterium]